jgi:LCP family protein required for cell wall assembly
VFGEYWRLGSAFIFTPENTVNSLNNRTNILILGKAGEGHIAPDLTDTIMLASFEHKSPQSITLIALPRDIWVDDLRTKLNSVYYWGKEKQELGGGLILAKSSVEEIVGIPVHYAVVIDFSGFTKVIDAIGGIDVDVQRSFIDKKYPIPGKENDECLPAQAGDGTLLPSGEPDYNCRYERLEFTKGLTHMDGATALKFSRSRQSEDEVEGTDQARSRRQQLVLNAIKDKVLTPETLASPRKVNMLFNLSQEITETDLSTQGQALLARRALQGKGKVSSVSIPEEYLLNPPISREYDNLYVFVPREESWSEITTWIQDLIK